jgi:hypothetical protein
MRVEALIYNDFLRNGIQEVSGSIPLISTKTEDRLKPLVLADFLYFSVVSRLYGIQLFRCVELSKM